MQHRHGIISIVFTWNKDYLHLHNKKEIVGRQKTKMLYLDEDTAKCRGINFINVCKFDHL